MEERQGFLRSGLRSLDGAAREVLSFESRSGFAYDAAHPLALGFRGNQFEPRNRVIQCLKQTIDPPIEQWRVLNQARRKQNLAKHRTRMTPLGNTRSTQRWTTSFAT